jgi:histidinol-phosphate phosphatase family protein
VVLGNPLQCVVLAGGLGTRMRPATERVPKALLDVAGRPFIDRQLEWLARCGVDEVVLCIGHQGAQLRAHVGARTPAGLTVRYSDEGEALRGTAGALRWALDQGLLREDFLTTYGDSFLPIDFSQVGQAFRASGQPALMTVFRNEGRWDTSNVVFEAGRLKLYDKKRLGAPAEAFRYIDYGLSAMRREVIAERVAPNQVADLADVLHALSAAGQLAGFEVSQRFYEIGSPEGLEALQVWVGAHRGLLILDRDGVLNRMRVDPQGRPDSPMSESEVEVFSWVPEALRRLHDGGWGLCIATNQPAAAKGKASREALEAVHRRILQEATTAGAVISSSHICWHRAEDDCSCRKPAPGLLLEALAAHPEYPQGDSWMVGDRPTDVQAAQAAGVHSALVGELAGSATAEYRGANLATFADFLIARPSG